jgi:hypothetical protein
MRRPFQAAAWLFVLALPGGTLFSSETPRVGGGGGDRTVNLDCGSGKFVVGAIAKGGKDNNILAPNILRNLKLHCRAFTNIDGGGAGPEAGARSTTVEATATATASQDVTQNDRYCGGPLVVTKLTLRAGVYIDQLTTMLCRRATWADETLNFNVGGSSGDIRTIECPAGEALYKLEAKTGASIDSLKGYCRAFNTTPLHREIMDSANPRPTASNPMKVRLRTTAAITFNVPRTSPFSFDLIVNAETDVLGGGGLNPPDYKLALKNPSGTVVETRNVTRAGETTLNASFNAVGQWRLEITNLKRDVGALDVTKFDIIP